MRETIKITITGTVQGVGFRPMVWHQAQKLGLQGRVLNNGNGVLIEVCGNRIEDFIQALKNHCPPLAHIDQIHRQADPSLSFNRAFFIDQSQSSAAHTSVTADAAICTDCHHDIFDPDNRRYQYPFTNCTHCGPRLSILHTIPYDRDHTSMAAFKMCPDCQAEYDHPGNRRFHAQPNACPHCGPRIWLENKHGTLTSPDPIKQLASDLAAGKIVAIKGIGGFHLACDAHNAQAVTLLRARKHRYQKPLAMMARDVAQIRQYCRVSPREQAALQHPSAPIVILDISDTKTLSNGIAPGQKQLGFMLPYSPLHDLILHATQGPLVMTSGNRSEEPQCISNADALQRLGNIADVFLLHNRDIVNRIDDSVQRDMLGEIRTLRRARGIAPQPIALPPGFASSPELLAMGGELKNTFCLIKDAQAVLSQHMGDLENAATLEDYQTNLELYQTLYQHQPIALVVDAHPEYLSSKWGRERANTANLPLIETQHHHAHIAACLGDQRWPLDAGKVLGVALDGLGYGADGQIWGGEFLLADYHQAQRLAHCQPTPMFGGAQAMREPWRNTYASIATSLHWNDLQEHYGELALFEFLNNKPLKTFDAMRKKGLNAPLASSAGRWFDAVAAALGICREQAFYEGQAAIELEALITPALIQSESAYDFEIDDPSAFWIALLDDLKAEVSPAQIACRFHLGLAKAVVNKLIQLADQTGIRTVALSGGVFQNKTLLQQVNDRAQDAGFNVLLHQNIPANDGGLAFGQALIAAANWRV